MIFINQDTLYLKERLTFDTLSTFSIFLLKCLTLFVTRLNLVYGRYPAPAPCRSGPNVGLGDGATRPARRRHGLPLARTEGGAFPAPGNVRKHAPRGYFKSRRPPFRADRRVDLTGQLRLGATRQNLRFCYGSCFAPRRQPPAAGTLRPRTGNMPDRIGGSAAFTSLRKE